MPNLKWHPSIINDLRCEPKCYESGIGDGFCDCVNNRSHCGFDGGDCCGETVTFMPGFPVCRCMEK